MPARTTLIRLTLSMLAITAVIGAIAVLMPPEEPGWRMASSEIAALSAIAALVACGLLLLLSRDDATKRPTLLQITWFVWVTGLLLLFLTHIWKDSFYFPMYFDASFTHQFIMWSLIGLGSIAMAVPILRNRAIFPRLGWQLSEALTLIGAAVALLASLYFDGGLKTDGLALALSVAVAFTMGLTSSLAAICAMPLAAGVNLHFVSPRHRILARVGICASLLSANLWIVMFLELLGFRILRWGWYQDLESSVHILLIASLISLAISIAVACWTMMRPMRLRGWTAFLLKASIGLVLVGHVIAAIMAIGPPDPVIFGRKSFDRFDP
ncbi:MAG: hypothetical protein EBQ99_07000, partial [Planctomycetes bacterium]|nr:hypothetical protein [Planctomycetota bacterium]